MDKNELNPEYLLPIVVGIDLFVTDFVFGWSRLSIIPMVLIMALVVGYLTTSIEDSVVPS